jgi:CRP-like cAMP-binding protein
MDDLHFIRPDDFFSSLSQSHRKTLIKIGSKRCFKKDEMIFHAGSAGDEVYILLNGRVKIFELSEEGKEVILWFCFAGELFGTAEVVKRSHREVNAQAGGSVTVLAIKYREFERFLQQNPLLALKVIELLSYRLRDLSNVLLNLASDDVTSRVVKLLSRLSLRYGKPRDKGIYLDIALTHQEMADMIGTSRQTVTTVLGVLKRNVVISQPPTLRALAS